MSGPAGAGAARGVLVAGEVPGADERPVRGHGRRPSAVVGWAVAALVAVAWFVTLWVSGSPAGDVARWLLAVGCAVVLPGFVLVRVCRRAVAPLVEDLTWAAPAGCLVALAGWFADRVLPWAPGAFVFGPVLVAVTLLVPAARRRVLARPAPGWGAGPALALGAVQLVALGWMTVTGLLAYPVDPGRYGTQYYPDIMYQLDLLGELRHALVPTYPPVAGTSLSYHWFLYAITAHLTTGTGVLPWDSTLRLGPAILVPAVIMLAAVVARRLARSVWAGPCAAVLLAVIGVSAADRWTAAGESTEVLSRVWRASPPQTLGWLAALAAAGVIFAFLRRAEDDRAVPVGLLVPFFVLCAGSKSSDLPVLLAGVGLAAVAALVRRQWPVLRRCVAVLVVGGAVFEAAELTIYGGGSYGVKLVPFGHALALAGGLFPGLRTHTSPYDLVGVHYPSVALLTAIGLFVLPLLPRLAGLLFQLRHRPADPGGWAATGTALAGLGLPFVLEHPAGSEIYFLYSAYPIGVVGAASGIAIAAGTLRHRLPGPAAGRAAVRWVVAAASAGAVVAALIAAVQPRRTPAHDWLHAHPGLTELVRAAALPVAAHWWAPMLELLAVLAVLALAVLLIGRRSSRSGPASLGARSSLAGIVVLALVLGPGLFTRALTFGGAQAAPDGAASTVQHSAAYLEHSSLPPTMRDAFAAGRWVDEHAGVHDVVVTNMYCRFSRASRLAGEKPCDARNFVASALTERHTLVGGWAYADRVVAAAWTAPTAYRDIPFWNQALFDEQYDAFARPTAALLDDLYVHHQVRWLFLDLRDPPVATAALDRLAILRFEGPSTAVYQLRAPQKGASAGE